MLPSNLSLLQQPRQAAAILTPLQIFGASLLAWYVADSGVYNDAGSTLATDTQTVQQWNDQSGNNYHLKQATAGLRPTYNAAGFNGRQTVTFAAASATRMDTDDDSVAIGSVATGAAFAVCQMLTGTESYGRVVSFESNGQNTDYDTPGAAAWLARQLTNNAIASYRNSAERVNQAISLATNYRLAIIYDGTNVTPYVNNSAGTSAAYSDSWSPPGRLSVGGDVGTGSNWDGAISEVVITNSAPTLGQRNSLDDYFRSKWGL